MRLQPSCIQDICHVQQQYYNSHTNMSILQHILHINIFDTPQLLHTRHTVSAMLSSNCVAATHNTTHSPCTSTCTTHPALHTQHYPTHCLPPPCVYTTNTRHSWHKMWGWCESVVPILFGWFWGGSIPTCACFHSDY